MFDKRVNLHNTAAPAADAAADVAAAYANAFAAADIKVTTFNRMTGATSTDRRSLLMALQRDPQTDGTDANLIILGQCSPSILGDCIDEDTTVLIEIGAGAVLNADPADVIKAGTGDDTLGKKR